MIEIISGTDRPNSNSRKISGIIESQYRELGAKAQVLDLCSLDFKEVSGGPYGQASGTFKAAIDRIDSASGVVLVIPEYNGSYPGALKHFIDYWQYPLSFEHRPVAYVGVGHRWGGLRPVEHMQQVFGYRNAYNFPNRVFVSNVSKTLVDGKLTDPMTVELLDIQCREFVQFIEGLRYSKLHALDRIPKSAK